MSITVFHDEPANILLVEDDIFLRRSLGELLRLMGYHLFTAANGREALDLLACCAVTMDLIITDVTMPVMGGFELAEAVATEYGAMHFILISGYNADIQIRKHEMPMGAVYLQKPFPPADLIRKITEVLASRKTVLHT